MPRVSSEYSICRSQIGCTAWGAADGIRADFGQADMPDVTGFHHLGDGADVSSIGTFGSSRAGR